jgi:hypothetical protein
MQRPTFDPPDKLDKVSCKDEFSNFREDEYNMAKFTWREGYKVVMTRKQKHEENKVNAWLLIYNQCLPKLKNRLEGANRYKNSKRDNHLVALLAMIRGYCCQFDTLNDEFVSIVESIKNLLYYFQKPSHSNSDCHEDFMVMV